MSTAVHFAGKSAKFHWFSKHLVPFRNQTDRFPAQHDRLQRKGTPTSTVNTVVGAVHTFFAFLLLPLLKIQNNTGY